MFSKMKQKLAAGWNALRQINLTLRWKILIADFLLIAIPVLVAAGLFGIFFNGPGAGPWQVLENVFHDDKQVLSAQSLLQTCTHREQLTEVKKEMKKAGYHFSVVCDGTVYYSNLTDSDKETGQSLAGSVYGTGSTYTITSGSSVVISQSFRDEGHTYAMTAVRTPTTVRETGAKTGTSSGEPYIKRTLEWFIGAMIVILLAVVVLLTLLMNRWIRKSILDPLKELSLGTEKIRSGDLDFALTSSRRDEIGVVIRDFDEMRQHLKESVAERLRYERSRREMIIGISHDLRTPLTSIKGYIEGLRDGIADTPEKRERYYHAVEISVASLERLTSDLSRLSRFEEGTEHFDLKRTELNEYFRHVIESRREKDQSDRVEIRLQESENPIFCQLDTGKMDRVIANLIGNTVKYREKDHSNVTISLSRAGGMAEIRMADDGPGVRDEDLPRVFECFFRGDAARTEPGKGSGIGLAVVKQIIEGLGGTVRAENDHGFAVILSLPVEGEKDEENPDRGR